MKSIIAYKENGIASLLVIGFSYFDNNKECDINSIIDCGHGIYLSTPMKDEAILPLKRAIQKIRDIDDENLKVDKQFIIDFIEPCFADFLDRQGLMNSEEGVYSFPDDFIIIQDDKIFFINNDFDFYEIDDFISIGSYRTDLLTAYKIGYNKELPMRDRIIANFKKINNVSNDNKLKAFYINTKTKQKEKIVL